MILRGVRHILFPRASPNLVFSPLAAFSFLSHFPTSLPVVPKIISQINYLHLNPSLWICSPGNSNLRRASDKCIGPESGECFSSFLPHSRKFWRALALPLSADLLGKVLEDNLKIMGQGGKNWIPLSPSTHMTLSGSLGTFGECDSEVDVLHWSRYNCFLLYQMGTFSAFLELLHMEIE